MICVPFVLRPFFITCLASPHFKGHGRPLTGLSSWNQKNLLADSPWSQTQVDTDASEMFYSPTRPGSASPGRTNVVTFNDQQSINNNRADRGAVNQAVNTTYRICFLSARPIRQAFAKMILAAQHEVNDDLVTRLQSFVDRDFSSYVVIAVSVNSKRKTNRITIIELSGPMDRSPAPLRCPRPFRLREQQPIIVMACCV